MPKTSGKREKLVNSAAKLFHQVGFNQTSLADISEDSGVPLGNVHYYFKTKAELILEVLNHRSENLKSWYEELNELPNPKDRLAAMIDDTLSLKHKLAKYGCPVGSLCQELDKEREPISKQADGLIKMQLKWLSEQFVELGKKNAEELSLQLIASLHGTAVVGNALKSPAIIENELRRLQTWILAM
ncbi:MAG: TetR/AcrR family transcriptional repressor of nem operon [Nitrospinales bacterium]|jgi:TetR/AcrR family transcriptional repressor of nem operon